MRLVAVAAPPWVERPRDLETAARLADLVEVRLDALDGASAGAWVAASPRPVLATVRSRAQGGAFGGTPEEAAALLIEAVEAGAAWVDCEAPVVALVARAARAGGARVLASSHAAGEPDLPRDGVDAWKVAHPVARSSDVRAVLDLARRLAEGTRRGAHPPAFLVPYGPLGGGLRVVTAAVAQASGADPFVYGAPAEGLPGATGPLAWLPPLAVLLDELRLGEIGPGARIFGLLGRPPTRSPSPSLHNAVFRSLGRDAVYLPEADLPPEDAFDLPWDGFSVTTPLKEAAARRCEELDAVARRCGAANTLVRGADGRLRGSNTDALAVLEAVRAHGVAGGGALVLGGGGFARAAAAALLEAGLRVRLGAGERARAVADLEVEDAGDEPRAREGDAVVVNATPVGADGALPAAFAALLASLAPGTLVLDGPYRAAGAPAAFAAAAAARGLPVEDGHAILLRQAAGQARAFTGAAADPLVLACARRPGKSVVFVGPRGAGKTTVARAVARRLGRPFADTDDAVARRAGLPVGEALASMGEAAFRRLEEEAVASVLARRGVVVAAGGGVPTRPANAAALAAGAFVVRLAVSPAEAARRIEADPAHRPRLLGARSVLEECERVAAAREGAYAAVADAVVATDGRAPDQVAQEAAALAARVFCGPGARG